MGPTAKWTAADVMPGALDDDGPASEFKACMEVVLERTGAELVFAAEDDDEDDAAAAENDAGEA